VWFARQENILVYPTGLIATIITVYLLYVAGYIGDMLINAYFTIMSIYGWYKWSRKPQNQIIYRLAGQIKKEKI
jgi:nicotinamide mononucleotide transporter